jgi:hypothetical protein
MLFRAEAFRGEIPLLEPHLLPENGAQVAVNCRLKSGSVHPLRQTTFVWTPTKAGTKKTIYRFGGQYWFHWIADVDVLRGPIAGDAAEATYFTGDGVPKVTDSSIAVQGGGTNYPTNSYILGVPAPAAAPSATVSGSSTDPTLAEDRRYVVTFVAGIGSVEMEGPPSLPSNEVTVEPSQSVNLTLPAIPGGAYNFLYKRIYRTVDSGVAGSTEYRYVGQVSAATSAFNDSVAAVNVGEPLPSLDWDAPPAAMHSLKLHPGGFMVGASGLDVCLSVAYQPHAWPFKYRFKVDHPVVGLGVFGTSILVATKAFPYIITGNSPDSMSIERLEIRQSCVSKRGIVDMGYAVAYPSPDGLMVVGLGQAINATEKLMSRDQWQALKPDSLLGAWQDGQYIGFYDTGTATGGFILDPSTETITWTDIHATAAWTDPVTDNLYLQVGGNIVIWDGGPNPRTLTWKSKLLVAPRPINFGVAQVLGEYPLTFKVYANKVLKHTRTVSSREPFYLPAGFLADRWEFEVSGTKAFHTVKLAEVMREVR